MQTQATVAALGVAVWVFVLQTMTAPELESDQVRSEYERQIGASPRLSVLLGLVGCSAAFLLLMQPAQAVAPISLQISARNLVLVSVLNLLVTLFVTWRFFTVTQRLSRRPELRRLELDVVQSVVRGGVDGFVDRLRTVESGGLQSVGLLFRSHPNEQAVEQALQVHFDALQRSMRDGRLADYERGFQALRHYIESAIDQFRAAEIGFGHPGAPASWHPLKGIEERLIWLKQEVLERDRWSPYARELTSFDYWQMNRGLRWRCGELYTAGVRGFLVTYDQASRREGSELAGVVVDRLWRLMSDAVAYSIWDGREGDAGEAPRATEKLDLSNSDDLQYLYYLAHQLERLLANALTADRSDDFVELDLGFGDLVHALSLSTHELEDFDGPARRALERLRQIRRTALLGLGGRAVRLAREGRVGDPQPYLDVVRSTYANLSNLVRDYTAILDEGADEGFLWDSWESEGARPLQTYSVETGSYPSIGFGLLALEFAADDELSLPMGGRADRARDLICQVLDELLPFVRIEGEEQLVSAQARLRDALQQAGQADALAAEDEIIAAGLDSERVDEFRARFLAGRFGAATLEPVFDHFGGLRFTRKDAATPPWVGWRVQLPKSLFADLPRTVHFFGHEQKGMDFERSLLERLASKFDDRDPIERPLQSADDLRVVIDEARGKLESDGLILVLTGDWSGISWSLRDGQSNWFDPKGGSEFAPRSPFLLGSYGKTILLLLTGGEGRRLLALDPGTWGCIEKAATEQGEFVAEVTAISDERATAILDERVAAGAIVDDPERARRELLLSVEWSHLEDVRIHEKDPGRGLVFVDGTEEGPREPVDEKRGNLTASDDVMGRAVDAR